MNTPLLHRLAGLGAALLLSVGAMAADSEKIPITTRSDDARKEFLAGRQLFENLKRKASVPHFQKALNLDSDFAMAAAFLAQSEGSARGFFDNIEKAVRAAANASEGERETILGLQAGGAGKTEAQRNHYENAVRLYPSDERALTQLGTHYFVQQEYRKAAEYFTKAVTVNPGYPQAYNLLGYTHRFLGDFAAAENAFKKYTTLIPDDPNPFDSYAELLLKTGRLEESIAMYRKALTIDQNFTPSRIGVATALLYADRPAEARREMDVVLDKAQDDTDRRQAMFVATLSYVEEGNATAALKELKKQYALGEKINDAAAMAGDLVAMGTIELEAGNIGEAENLYAKSLQIVEKSALAEDVKALTRLGAHYNDAVIAAAKGDFMVAQKHAEELFRGAESRGNKNQIRLAHEAKGRIALAQEDYARTLTEMAEASQQNPYNLYRIALAHAGLGQNDKAKSFLKAAAEFSGLPQLNYALIRHKAKTMLTSM